MERIIDVYYGRDNLPYKDEARTIHFPVAGSEFLGASQTTTIRFHYEQIGTDENVYTVESKRPDGKPGSELLSKNTTEHYAEMSLSGWYSECKGDLFLSLKVYKGGSTATYNEEARLWEVNGVPIIESTGAIKLAINYTPVGRYEDYDDAVETFQKVLAALGDKLDTIKGIVGVSGLSQVDTTEYEEGQLFFDVDTKNIYKLESGEFVKINNKLEIVDVSGYEYEELFAMFGTDPFYSYFEETTNIAIYQFKVLGGSDYALYVWTYKNGCLYMPYVDMSSIFSIDDFTNLEYEKAPVVELSNPLGQLTDFEYEQLLQPNASVKYSGEYYVKYIETDHDLYFTRHELTDSGSVISITNSYIYVDKDDKDYETIESLHSTYTKSKTDELLSGKQNTLVNQVNIKSINGTSLLGSGNIDIQGGSGDAEWGSIGGDIADQTDLQDELQDIREVAEGKCNAFVLSYGDTIAYVKSQINTAMGKRFFVYNKNTKEFEVKSTEILNGNYDNVGVINPDFNSNNDAIYVGNDYNLIVRGIKGSIDGGAGTSYCLISLLELSQYYYQSNTGDVFYVKEVDVPDRWYSGGNVFYKLETSKIDLTNYATKTELATKSDLSNIAPNYDSSNTYTVGEVVLYNGSLYRCKTDISTAESWDATHWESVNVASDFVNLTGTQVISGGKTFTDLRTTGSSSAYVSFEVGSYVGNIEYDVSSFLFGDDVQLYVTLGSNALIPAIDNSFDIGSSSYAVKDIYAKGVINPNSSGYGLSLPSTTSFTANKEIATKDYFGFKRISLNDFKALDEASKRELLDIGCQIIGQVNKVKNPTLFTGHNYGAYIQGIAIGEINSGTGQSPFIGSYEVFPATVGGSVNLRESSGGIKIIDSLVRSINDIPLIQFYKKPQSSVSLTDGGTITDNALKTLIQNGQPIDLNGFTCYFSCDDGTNYQYVSTRYDSSANKNHINVITINKSTWVATFHTSDIAV